MLKPISAEELMAEFQKIKEKMDEKYRTFATGERGGGMVMPSSCHL